MSVMAKKPRTIPLYKIGPGNKLRKTRRRVADLTAIADLPIRDLRQEREDAHAWDEANAMRKSVGMKPVKAKR